MFLDFRQESWWNAITIQGWEAMADGKRHEMIILIIILKILVQSLYNPFRTSCQVT
jgi:hypothetical protein